MPLRRTTMNLLNCAVCQCQLTDPITLSCGYTICSKCFPHEQTSTFVCPVKQCNKGKHLFGPALSTDQVLDQFVQHNYLYTDLMFYKENFDTVATLLKCPLGEHPLEHPITTHCGHSFCKLCLLQHRISNDSCTVCQKRLPGYAFTQNYSTNVLLSIILPAFYQLPKQQERQRERDVVDISFSHLECTTYEKMPVYLTDFPVLPSQKIRIPISSPQHLESLLQAIFPCKEYQSLCLAVLQRSRMGYNSSIGTIVKINNIESRASNIIIDIVGLDRYQVTSVYQEIKDFIQTDIETRFEAKCDLVPYMKDGMHWVDAIRSVQTTLLPPLPSPSTSGEIMSTDVLPPSPPAEFIYDDRSTTRISKQIHNFISEFAHSHTSFNFCSTVEGLLGPVWLQSVQNLHGKLPPADHAVAMCWWSAIVLPISNIERTQILRLNTLEARLNTVLSWINDLRTQKGEGRRAAMVPVTGQK